MRLGRPRKVVFPIQRIEVVHGMDILRTVEENTTVNCVQCGMTFLINRNTTYLSQDDVDSRIQMVRCPHCMRRASIYHYYDRIAKPKRRKQNNL